MGMVSIFLFRVRVVFRSSGLSTRPEACSNISALSSRSVVVFKFSVYASMFETTKLGL